MGSLPPDPPSLAFFPPRFLEDNPIFEDLPKAKVLTVSQSQHNDLSHAFQLVYTIELEYRQFKWQIEKRAAQVLFLHLALKKRALLEELQEKQEQVKEWVHSLRLGEQSDAGESLHPHDGDDQEEISHSSRTDVPSSAVLPVMRPALGSLPSISRRAVCAMQNYLNHFLQSLNIVNTSEVCRFLEVSKLSFAPEYGPKLKEGYVMVQHLPNISTEEGPTGWSRYWNSCYCCRSSWQQVWAVLKPGFLALLADPSNVRPLDIFMFDVLAPSDTATEGLISLARVGTDRNPLRYSFMVTCGNRVVKLRTSQSSSSHEWVAAINDAGLRAWCHPHRFGSFAPPRGLATDGSQAQWFIDGKAAFEAITVAIEDAKSEIFITGWWLCPELYLRRPFNDHAASRLDCLLEAKAKIGVQIYVLLYKEVALALKINSNYTKTRLLSIHENIKVLRFPDHFSSGVYLWSHHEKLVIVDHQICFLGGLDLCFGRYDDTEHSVSDLPPSTWPGKDYYNPRESEPNSWEDTMKDELDRKKLPRMPWHDVHCALWGPPCRDIARHFVQRWNYAKRSKAPNQRAIPLLLPHNRMVIPHFLTGHEEAEALVEHELQQASDTARSSYADIPLLLPKEQGHEVDRRGSGNRMERNPRELVGISPLCGTGVGPYQHFHDVDKEQIFKENGDVGGKWWEVEEGEPGQVAKLDPIGDVGPRVACRCQVIRSVGQWSAGTSQPEERSIHAAYCSLIEKAQYFIYIENQFFISGLDGDDTIHNRLLEALYLRIMRAHKEGQCFRVIVVMPLLPGFQGGVDEGGAASVRLIMHWQYRTICRGRHSLLQRLFDTIGPEAENYVSFYGLRNHGRLYENGPLATSQVYVHSKIMIVDDRTVLIGSANINDRSLLGSRDSEMGVVLEDDDYVSSTMAGKPWRAGRFAYSLRLSLWAEHLGIQPSKISLVRDPVCDATYKDVWMSRARLNTSIYATVFGCIPADSIHSRVALRQALAQRKEKAGHTTIDLGIAPEELDTDSLRMEVSKDKPTDGVRGHLVFFPLEFMSQVDLRPVFNESEYYASSQIFH